MDAVFNKLHTSRAGRIRMHDVRTILKLKSLTSGELRISPHHLIFMLS